MIIPNIYIYIYIWKNKKCSKPPTRYNVIEDDITGLFVWCRVGRDSPNIMVIFQCQWGPGAKEINRSCHFCSFVHSRRWTNISRFSWQVEPFSWRAGRSLFYLNNNFPQAGDNIALGIRDQTMVASHLQVTAGCQLREQRNRCATDKIFYTCTCIYTYIYICIHIWFNQI